MSLFLLLCTNAYPIIDNARADLNRYYRDFILCIKQAEDLAIPLIRVRRNTQKTIWKCDPLLKKVIWSACGRPSRGTVFDIKQKTKLKYKRHLRAVRYSGETFPKSNSEQQKVINSAKFPDASSSDIISRPSWIEHYSKIVSKVNYAVHKRFSYLLEKNLPSRLCQRGVIPVEKWDIVKGIKGLKSKSLDIDGISVLNPVPNSFELVSHL